jgi:predicted phosphodiesterase
MSESSGIGEHLMRIAVISDMHGNLIGLDAALTDLKASGVDQIICLGDCIQGGPQPAQVVAQLRELSCPIVMGNADSFLLTGEDTALEPTDSARWQKLLEVREWTLAQLSEDDREFIGAFQPTVEVQLDSTRKLIGFHGTPKSFDEIIVPGTPEADVQRMLGGYEPHFLCGGHTHIQQIRHLGQSFYFGCGSTGLAYRHNQPDPYGTQKADHWVEFAVFSVYADKRVSLEFRRVPFDVDALIDEFRSSGRPFADEAIAQYQ